MRDPAVDDRGLRHAPRTARRQASIFGIMPADRDGSSCASSSVPIWLTSESVSGQRV